MYIHSFIYIDPNLQELFFALLYNVELATSEDVETDRQQTFEAADHSAVGVFVFLG